MAFRFSMMPYFCCALRFRSSYPLSMISSRSVFLGRPRVRFPSILPSNASFISPSFVITCPIHFSFLLNITSMISRFSWTQCGTSSFVTLSLQLMFSIFLHIHITNASIFFLSSLVIVHVSLAYSATLHIHVFMILFLIL